MDSRITAWRSNKEVDRLLRDARRSWRGRADVFWHETSADRAHAILADGFRTGLELQVGERTGAVFFTAWSNHGATYARGGQPSRYVPVCLSGLTVVRQDDIAAAMTLSDLRHDIVALVESGTWTLPYAARYQAKLWMDDGRLPDGVDGIVIPGYELALSKEAANQGLSAALAELGLPAAAVSSSATAP